MKGAPNNSSFLNQRRHEEAPEDSICKRDAFQRDRDRIMHSRAFRRMMHKTQIFNANMGGDYPEFCVTAKMRCKIELIFQGGSGVGCARLVYNITPTGAEVKGHPRSLWPRQRYSAP